MTDKIKLPEAEQIKQDSHYLRGTIINSLNDHATGAISEDDTKLTKFHGIYQQDNRDLRDERRKQKLEPRFQFMLRLRLPGGVLTPEQWLGLDDVADRYADGSLRLTTRQTFQFHEIFKHQLRPLVQQLAELGLDSRGACGDDNRNVITNANPHLSGLQQQIYTLAVQISESLSWRSEAYEETWLEQPAKHSDAEEEPFYSYRYLPRKFKIAIALPPRNDCDVFANDVALIAIEENGQLVGFNVAVGGGMGMTYGDSKTYPRIASPVGFVPVDDIVNACLSIAAIQRDHGDRTNRAHARFKYTLDDYGLDWFCERFAEYHGKPLQPLRDYELKDSGDNFGWLEDEIGHYHLTLRIPSGRVIDRDELKLRTALREIARIHKGEFRITCNQNVIISNVEAKNKPDIERLVASYGLDDGSRSSPLARNAISCVAFPTCGLAMAEAERYMPALIGKLEALMQRCGIEHETIQLRVSGCPNGCARPYLGEIALTGKAPGKYSLFLGADTGGQRMNRLYQENISEAEILDSLQPLFERFASERQPQEGFGDFLYRSGLLEENTGPLDFHQPVIAKS